MYVLLFEFNPLRNWEMAQIRSIWKLKILSLCCHLQGCDLTYELLTISKKIVYFCFACCCCCWVRRKQEIGSLTKFVPFVFSSPFFYLFTHERRKNKTSNNTQILTKLLSVLSWIIIGFLTKTPDLFWKRETPTPTVPTKPDKHFFPKKRDQATWIRQIWRNNKKEEPFFPAPSFPHSSFPWDWPFLWVFLSPHGRYRTNITNITNITFVFPLFFSLIVDLLKCKRDAVYRKVTALLNKTNTKDSIPSCVHSIVYDFFPSE